MNVLITGATGFLGGRILEEFSRRPEFNKILGTGRKFSTDNKVLAPNVEYLLGDLTNLDFVDSLFEQPIDVVINCAGLSSPWGSRDAFYQANYLTQKYLLEASERVGVKRSFPFFVGLAILGVPFEIFMTVSGIHYFVQFYNHNKLVGKSGLLEYIMVTPSHHRVHHGTNAEYIHKNFGGTLVLWDKLFGTFQPELAKVPVDYGVIGYEQVDDVVVGNNLPFRKLLHLSEKVGNRKSNIIPTQFVATAGLLLFSLLLYYVYQENVWPVNWKMFFFGIIFFGTIANGAFSDGKKWGIWLWVLDFLLLSPLFLISQQLYEPVLVTLFIFLAAHALLLIFSLRSLLFSPL